jgi:phospholipase C
MHRASLWPVLVVTGLAFRATGYVATGSTRASGRVSVGLPRSKASRATKRSRYPIDHIIIIDRENHSFDNLFGRFPGSDGATTAELPNGRTIDLGHTPDHAIPDIGHAGDSAAFAADGGRMDRFSDLPGAIQNGKDIADSQYYQSDIPDYWSYASNFALDDHFFATIMGPSFPNHLVTIAASSANTIDNPCDNTHHAWGCDSGPFTVVPAVDAKTGRPYLARSRPRTVWSQDRTGNGRGPGRQCH